MAGTPPISLLSRNPAGISRGGVARAALAAAVATLVALAPPVVAIETVTEGFDPAGDQVPGMGTDHLDLVKATITSNGTHVRVRFEVSDLEPSQPIARYDLDDQLDGGDFNFLVRCFVGIDAASVSHAECDVKTDSDTTVVPPGISVTTEETFSPVGGLISPSSDWVEASFPYSLVGISSGQELPSPTAYSFADIGTLPIDSLGFATGHEFA